MVYGNFDCMVFSWIVFLGIHICIYLRPRNISIQSTFLYKGVLVFAYILVYTYTTNPIRTVSNACTTHIEIGLDCASRIVNPTACNKKLVVYRALYGWWPQAHLFTPRTASTQSLRIFSQSVRLRLLDVVVVFDVVFSV